jgi:hypothetical protein
MAHFSVVCGDISYEGSPFKGGPTNWRLLLDFCADLQFAVDGQVVFALEVVSIVELAQVVYAWVRSGAASDMAYRPLDDSDTVWVQIRPRENRYSLSVYDFEGERLHEPCTIEWSSLLAGLADYVGQVQIRIFEQHGFDIADIVALNAVMEDKAWTYTRLRFPLVTGTGAEANFKTLNYS